MKFQKMAKERKTALTSAALMIRFRTIQPLNNSHKYATYQQIAQALNLTVYEVQHICRKALLPTQKLSWEKRVRILDQEHIDFLVNPRTLERWAGFTMKQRAIYFHRQFTNKRIAVTTLRRLYSKHGIKRKKVR